MDLKKNNSETVIQKNREGDYLTFFLGQEEYAIEILKVVEIVGFIEPTCIPRTPGYILGIINLRGKILPVLDLRLKFNMEQVDRTEETVIIDVQVGGVEIGVVVDRVSEVLNIKKDLIEDAPNFGAEADVDFILGIAKVSNSVKIMLDIERVLSSSISQVSQLVEKVKAA